MGRSWGIEDSELGRCNRPAGFRKRDHIGRWIEAEFPKAGCPIRVGIEAAHGIADMHETQRGFHVGSQVGRVAIVHSRTRDRPRGVVPAVEHEMLPPYPDLDTRDRLRRGSYEPFWREPHQIAERRRLSRKDHQTEHDDECDGGGRGGGESSHGGFQRRLHQTATPRSSVESGRTTSRMRNTLRICRLVSVISGRL